MIAGSPCALDSVPLLAKRQTLFTCEDHDQNDVAFEALDAYYANDEQVLIDFCREHDINYLVIDLETYSREYLDKGQIFFEPYNQEVLPLIVDRDKFVLAEIPSELKAFQAEDFFVVLCDDLEKIH